MKWFLALLSAYLLLLAAFPCHDGVECGASKTEVSAQKHSHDSHSEQCPPFCSCACCGVQMAFSTPFIDFPVQLFSGIDRKQPSFYFFRPAENNLSGIWQPPRLSVV